MTRTVLAYHPLRLLLAALAIAALALALWPGRAGGQGDRLSSRPRPAVKDAPALAVGAEVRTGAAERRRVTLPGRATLYVNASSRVKLDAPTRISLLEGEIYVESSTDTDPLVVKSPQREVSARAAHFGVRTLATGTSVVVARGKVQVSGLDTPINAGQQLAVGAARPVTAQRASHLLDWTRELMAAADSPLVPASRHTGGALVATTPTGADAKINLRKYHLDVHIEDGFARTTIDQTYFNEESSQLEGTFYLPLPPDASLTRLAMYVDGQLMEGGMIESHLGRNVYETIRYANRDPALLEWLDGSTFKMRVFPIEGRQEKRILLSYTQRLPVLYGQNTYRFPAGHSLDKVRDWSLHVRARGAADWFWSSPSHTLTMSKQNGDLILDGSAKDARFDRDVVVTLNDTRRGSDQEGVQFSATKHEGKDYFLARYRPALEAQARTERRDWVFLFETSGDRDPLLARAQVDVIEHLLAQAGPEDTFSVLTASTRVRAFDKAPRPATPENVQAAVAFLEKSHLVGALDLDQALREAAALMKGMKNPHLVHVGSGIAAMGEQRQDVLAARVPAGARYVGVGVGRRWDRGFMKLAAERSGGLFAQINPDESVRWRAFELAATLSTPRLLDVKIEDDAGNRYLAFDQALAQGEELAAVTRLGARGMPRTVTVRGTLDGQEYVKVLPVRDVAPNADYLPRTWAKQEIDRLLADNPVENKEQIVGLSKALYVMTPFTSLLVLENDDLYTQYKVDRGRKDHWAMYPAPNKIEVVYEPDPSQPDQKLLKSGKKLPAIHVVQSVVVRSAANPQVWTGLRPDDKRPEVYRAGGRVQLASRGSLSDLEALDFTRPDVFSLPESLQLRPLFFDTVDIDALEKASSVAERAISLRRAGAITEADARELLAGQFGGKAREMHPSGSLHMWDLAERESLGRKFAIGGETPSSHLAFAQNLAFTQDRALVSRGRARFEVASQKLLPNAYFALEKSLIDPDELKRGLVKEALPTDDLLYRPMGYREDAKIFADLLGYAPGMNTSMADIAAVIEAEALPDPRDRIGRIDAAARTLLDKARAADWNTFQFTDSDGSSYTIHFDGKGRYAIDATLPHGLKERVACDGTTLLHLYPQLNVGARRTVSRFHRAEFASLVPWAVPPADDLARGADVKLSGERTVAVVPHEIKGKDGKPIPQAELRLVFAEDGRLTERQVMRAGEVIRRELCAADGTVRVLDGKDKELAVRKGTLRPASAPDLSPDVKALVVIPLPYRTPEHVQRILKIEQKNHQQLRFDEALPLLSAFVGQGNGSQAHTLFQQAFHSKEQRQLGYYVLLAAAGANLDAQHANVLAEHLDDPVAQYLALHSSPVLRQHASQWAVNSGQFGEGLPQHLALTHALYQKWQSGNVLKGDEARVQADVKRALEYVRRNQGSAFGWALLCLMRDRAAELRHARETASQQGVPRPWQTSDKALSAALAECWPLFADVPGLAYVARYEEARALFHAGKTAEARKRFEQLYESTLRDGALPPVETDFRAALGDGWLDLMRRTGAALVGQKHRPAVFALAWQCWQLDDAPLANHLASSAVEGVDDKDLLPMRLAAVRFYWQTGQLVEADRVVKSLLDDKRWSGDPALWRLASQVASKRGQEARSLECLERSLAGEFAELPETIDLNTVREEYGRLLGHYQGLADAMETLKVPMPEGFLAKVVSAADRWRALDRDGASACQTAARVLQRLGERELGWDYLTTPVGQQPNESGPWVSLAHTLNQKGDLELADRAYSAAFQSEPTNAQILWDRAQNLRQGGKTVEARQLLRQLADGSWQPRFQNLKSQAHLQLGGG